MNIALIHHRLARSGGLETRLINYIHAFSGKGFGVTVICANQDYSVSIPESVHVVRLSVGFVPKKFRRYAFEQRVSRFMETHRFDFSLSLERTSSQDAVLAPSNHLGFLRAMNRKGNHFSDRMEIGMDRRAYENSRTIFAASSMVREELIDLYHTPPSKIHVLYPPLDEATFNTNLRPRRAELRSQQGMDPEKLSFAFVSTSHRRKGLPLLLEVFDQLRSEPFELIVAGKGSKPSGFPENVKLAGYMREPQALYTAADFTIHPARYEPFGQVVSESLACGTPVIISGKTGAGEILSPSDGLIIEGFNPEEWVSAIRSLPQRNFSPDPGFIARNKLSVSDHVDQILALAHT
ncbi:MAG: glycosyltransferase family 4 protein [Bacteroidia bacterium]